MKYSLSFLILIVIAISCTSESNSVVKDTDATGVEIVIDHLTTDTWEISYDLAEPTDAFLLLGTTVDPGITDHFDLSAPSGQPEVHFVEKTIGEQTFTLVEAISKDPISKFSISLSKYDAPDRWFRLFRTFSDGIAIFSGHFRGYIFDFDGEEFVEMKEVLPKFTAKALSGENVVSISGESNTSISFPTYKKANGAYIYFGSNSLETHEGIKFLVDPEIPDDAAGFSRDVTALTLNFYTQQFGALSKPPVVFFNHSTVHSGGASGSSLDGQFLVTIYGEGSQGANDNPWENLAHVVIHEAIHQWNAIEARDASETDASWIWEGGAELLTWETLKDSDLIDQSRYDEKLLQLRQLCIDQLGSSSLMDVIDDEELAKYRCGQYFQQLAVLLMKKSNASRSAYSLWKAIYDYAQSNGGEYTIDSYYQLIKASLDTSSPDKAEILKTFPTTGGDALEALEATLEL